MAFLEITFRSHALNMNADACLILPETAKSTSSGGAPEGAFKTLFLLHGLNGNHRDWRRRTSVERYANRYGIAVVMPAGGRTWYTDTAYDAKYFTYITKELPQVCRSYFCGIQLRRESTFIAGNSMGGYGALKAALTYPENYGGCAALSGALDITRKNRPYKLEEWRSIFGFDLESADALEGTKEDLFFLANKAAKGGADLPELFLTCGTEDSLIGINRDFHARLKALEISHGYEERPGAHNWDFWDEALPRAFAFLFEKK